MNKNEIFGLLGPNGAGKSTTFNIITSMIKQSSGSVRLLGEQIENKNMGMHLEIGICPQFDCLWDNLTAIEHLQLFGRIKGLSSDDLLSNIRYLMNSMQLIEFSKTKAKNLSGGNKRKVCFCNAVVGNPSIIFLDEPSNGLDPVARRYLWKTLFEINKKRKIAVVLTTHSMAEAEFLCNKIGYFIIFFFKKFLIF